METAPIWGRGASPNSGELSNSEEYGIILRAKEAKTESKEWLYFDLIPEEYEIEKGSQPTGRFCVGLKPVKDV